MRNFKKTLSFLLSTVIIVSSVVGVGTTVFAATDEHTYKNFKYRILDDNTAEICGYTGKNAVVTVPDSIDSKPVTSIGRTAFYSGKIKEVTIPNTVRSIKWWAFYGCESLEKINLNFGLKTVGYGAFMNCKKLKSVSIPMSVTQICDDSFAVSCSTQKGVFDTYSKQTISTQQYSTDSSFTLEGYSGTVAEKYCNDNSLNFVSSGNVIYGDVDNNGTVEAADAKLAKSLIDTVPTEEELTAADVDDDGKITENDVNLILQAVGNEFYAQLFPCAKAMYSAPDYLSGRTMYCDGDSVAYGSGTDTMGNSTYSFCNYVAEKYNMTMTNKATPGTTLAIRKDFIGTDHRSILERVREMKGNIVATGIGDTVITISTSDGKTKNVNVNVKFLAMAVSFGKNKISLSEGNSSLLNLSVADGEATCSTTYSSTDPTVASVDENSGKITANKTGKTTVSCTTANGVTVRCLVYVTSSAQTKMQKA